jgi:hypothetical protein
MQQIEAFPLQWPDGFNRTPPNRREISKFKQSMDQAQIFLREEVGRMEGRNLIISTNIPVRKDGGLFTDWMNRKIDDPGVAIYFKRNEQQVAMCCDTYLRIWENVYALGKTIEAMRGISRWGSKELLDRAFTGFTALPAPAGAVVKRKWWEVLEVSLINSTWEEVKASYRALVLKYHPDRFAGDSVKFQEVAQAYEEAESYFGIATKKS